MISPLRLQVGPSTITGDCAKQKTLVKLLALAPGHWLTHDDVVETFWADAEPQAASTICTAVTESPCLTSKRQANLMIGVPQHNISPAFGRPFCRSLVPQSGRVAPPVGRGDRDGLSLCKRVGPITQEQPPNHMMMYINAAEPGPRSAPTHANRPSSRPPGRPLPGLRDGQGTRAR